MSLLQRLQMKQKLMSVLDLLWNLEIQKLPLTCRQKIQQIWRFWKTAAQFLAGKAADAVTAVEERRHDTVVHLATSISVNDLLHQIERNCPPETPIPSAQWLRLQFWPKDPTRRSSLQFTGLLPLKFIVQTSFPSRCTLCISIVSLWKRICC